MSKHKQIESFISNCNLDEVIQICYIMKAKRESRSTIKNGVCFRKPRRNSIHKWQPSIVVTQYRRNLYALLYRHGWDDNRIFTKLDEIFPLTSRYTAKDKSIKRR